MIEWLQGELKHSPEILLFLSLAIGFWIGQFQFGKFQVGGVAGSLLVAVILSLIGVPVDNGVKAILLHYLFMQLDLKVVRNFSNLSDLSRLKKFYWLPLWPFAGLSPSSLWQKYSI